MPGWVFVSRRISPGQALRLVPAEVRARHAPAAEAAVRAQRIVAAGGVDLGGDVGGDHMARPARLVLRVVVVPAVRQDVGHGERAVAHHGRGELPARRIGLDHHDLGHLGRQPRRRIRALGHDVDADRGAFVVGLHDIRRRQDMPRLDLGLAGQAAFHHGKPLGPVGGLGALLVHGERGGEHAGMGVGDAQPFEQALHAAILAPAAMKRVERDVGGDLGKTLGEVRTCVHLHHVIPFCPQGGRAFATRRQRHLALGRGSAHQHRHLGGCPARHARHSFSGGLVTGPCFLPGRLSARV
jgi:hypothetical protein